MRFYKEAEKARTAVAERVKHIDLAQDAITEYWALVRSRVRVHAYPPRPYNLPGQAREQFSQEEKDVNEHEGYAMYSTEGDETRADADGVIAMLMHRDRRELELRKVRWVVGMTNDDDKVVLPDLFPLFIVPILHNIMFFGIQGAEADSPSVGWVRNFEEVAELCFRHARKFIVARSEQALLKLRPNQEGVALRGAAKPRKRRVFELASQGALKALGALVQGATEEAKLAKPETEAKTLEESTAPAMALGEGDDQ